MARLREILLPWDSQPQEAVEVDWANPITQGLAFLSNSATRLDVVSGTASGTFGANPSVVVGVNGLAIKAGTDSGYQWESKAANVLGSITVLSFCNPFNNSTDQSALSKATTNGATASPFDFGVSTANLRLARANTGYRVWAGAASFVNSVDQVLVASQGADISVAPRFYINGVFDTGAATNLYGGTGSGAATSNTTPVRSHNRGDLGTDWVGDRIYLSAVWNRVLSDAEIASLSANPWQLFAPRQIFIPGSAAGATTHATTGALTGAGSSIVGSAAHIATHATTGVLTGAGSSVVGSAARTREHPTSGVLTGAGSEVVGSAAHQALHTTSGALTGQGSEIVGAAARTRAHPSSGALTGPGSQIVGAADHAVPGGVHDTSGALVGAGSQVVGSAAHIATHVTSGALTGQGSAVVGSAARATGAVTHATSGALIAQGAIVAGSAAHISAPVSHSTAGTLIGQGALVVGLAFIGNALVFGSLVGSTRKTHSDRPSSTISATRRNIQTSRR